MKIDLTGRIALVTGSTAGIGKAIAAMLARAGAEVIVNGLDAAQVDAVATELGARGIVANVGTSPPSAPSARPVVAEAKSDER